MRTWVALLRAVNVGGRRVKMAELRGLFEELGLREPETHVQSGNVIFGSALPRAELASLIEEGIERRCGFFAEAILRAAPELAAALAGDPFTEDEAPTPKWLVVQFTRDEAAKAAIARLADEYEGPELIRVAGEAYVYFAQGQARSKLGAALKRARVYRSVTARNIKVVRALAEKAAAR